MRYLLLLALAVSAWAQQRPCPADDDDPGRPVLRRGKTVKRQQNCDGLATVIVRPDSEASPGAAEERADVPLSLIDQVRLKAASYTGELPNFVCDQIIRRHNSGGARDKWKLQDTIAVEVMFVDGKEEYRNTKRNGKPVEWLATRESGSWSEGEYGRTLAHVMSPGVAEFTPLKKETIAGVEVEVFTYTVPKSRSGWTLEYDNQKLRPKFSGKIWIDPSEKMVRRLEMEAQEIPNTYPLDHAEMTMDFGPVKIGSNSYVLPTNSANLACVRYQKSCSKNDIEFKNYRKFSAESTISTTESTVSFENEAPKPPAQKQY